MTGLLAHGLVQRANLPLPEWLFGWAAAVVLVVSFARSRSRGRARGSSRTLAAAASAGPRARLARRSRSCSARSASLLLVGDDRGRLRRPGRPAVELHAGLRPDHLLGRDGVRQRAVRRHLPRAEPVAAPRPGPSACAGDARTRRSSAGGRPRSACSSSPGSSWPPGWGEQPGAAGHRGGRLQRRSPGSGWRSTASRPGPAAARRSRSTSTSSRAWRSSRSAADEVGIRPPLGRPAVTRAPARNRRRSSCVMIGTVTFDGLSQGAIWSDISTSLFDTLGSTLPDTIGLLLGVGLVGRLLPARDGRRDDRRRRLRHRRTLARAFVHSLVPIAAVYVAAHYLTFLHLRGPGDPLHGLGPVRPGLGPVRLGRRTGSTTACCRRTRPGTSRSGWWSPGTSPRSCWRTTARLRSTVSPGMAVLLPDTGCSGS